MMALLDLPFGSFWGGCKHHPEKGNPNDNPPVLVVFLPGGSTSDRFLPWVFHF